MNGFLGGVSKHKGREKDLTTANSNRGGEEKLEEDQTIGTCLVRAGIHCVRCNRKRLSFLTYVRKKYDSGCVGSLGDAFATT